MPTWARAFGAQANVTYINAKNDLPLFCPAFINPCAPQLPFDPNATVRNLPIPDVSKWTWNLVGMYERGPLSVRLSYNHRSSYPEGALDQRREGPGNAPINYTLQGRGNPVSRLDLSTTYNVTDNFTLFFDWTNILKKPFKSDIVRTNYTNGASRAARRSSRWSCGSRNRSCRAASASASAVASLGSRRPRRRRFRLHRRPRSSRLLRRHLRRRRPSAAKPKRGRKLERAAECPPPFSLSYCPVGRRLGAIWGLPSFQKIGAM